jgi:broad specificity polyphosphatase/5'/3'-nucleotidase SurE
MCVLAALTGAFGPVPDVVVSGVNDGHNLGRAVLHSGTVGAALTARMLQVPALAVSAPSRAATHQALGGPEADRRAADLVARLLARLDGWPAAALNVNLPAGEWHELRPAVLSSSGAIRLSVGGDRSVTIELETSVDEPDPAGTESWPTDRSLVARGIASITPLSPVTVAATDGQVADLTTAGTTRVVTPSKPRHGGPMTASPEETTDGRSDEPGDSSERPGDPAADDRGTETAEPEELDASLEDIPKVFPHGSAHPTSDADAPPPG